MSDNCSWPRVVVVVGMMSLIYSEGKAESIWFYSEGKAENI